MENEKPRKSRKTDENILREDEKKLKWETVYKKGGKKQWAENRHKNKETRN